MGAYAGDGFHGGDCSITFGSFTASVRSIGGPSMTRDAIDVSAFDSPDDIKQFIPGMVDMGEVTFDVIFDPDDLSGTKLPALMLPAAKLTITWGDATKWEFEDAFCTAFSPNAPLGDVATASATFKISGGAGGHTGGDVDFDAA